MGTALIVGAICAAVFMLIGPIGIIVIGLLLVLAGVSNKEND